MKQPTGLLPLYLASSVTEQMLVANSEERLQAILASLEQCRTALARSGRLETAKLVSLAILDLRIDLTRTSDSDLKALCDALAPDEGPTGSSKSPSSPGGERRCAMLKLVK